MKSKRARAVAITASVDAAALRARVWSFLGLGLLLSFALLLISP